MEYLQYLNYLIKHKWFVMIECFKVKLHWRGIIHDWSKFLPSEFAPYANYFFGNEKESKTRFDYAWQLHQKRNKHHWQWWVTPRANGNKTLLMPDKYRKEMLADWRGASKAQGYGDNTRKWYLKNRERMQIHPKTKKWIEKQLDL